MVGVLRSTDDAPLRPTPTDPNDLSDLLDAAANASIDVTVETTGAFPSQVGESCVVALHRITQEALTNIARHAGAAATTLRIDHAAEHVEINISNEGGASPNVALESTGVGIIGMRERASLMGGTFQLRSSPGRGTRIRIEIPFCEDLNHE